VVDMVAIGEFISAMRQRAGLTQEQLAAQVGITHQAVSKWENGTSLPDAGLLVELADELGVSIEEILRGVRRKGDRMTAGVPKNWRRMRVADGYHTKNVYRDGNVVHKDVSAWTPTVHALLEHLEKHGFPAPRVVGSGFDDDGREVITFIDGEVINLGPWSRDAAHEIGVMLRRLHEVTRSFVAPSDAVWYPWFGRDLGSRDKVIGHCDLGPWNIVQRSGMPIAMIDWDFAGPVDPLWDLAYVCWLNAKLHDDIVAEIEGLPPVEERATQLRAIADGYGLAARQRRDLVQKAIEVAIMETAAEGDLADIGPDTRPASLAHDVPWALAWRARAAAWMIRNRTILEEALG
jgi:transcriptional regulator with XRE-family HTH domain